MIRRRFLIAAGLGGVGLGSYALHRGVRSPTNSLQSSAPPTQVKIAGFAANIKDLILVKDSASKSRLRAFAPEPELSLEYSQETETQLSINNIAADAILESTGTASIFEETKGITRHINLTANSGTKVNLKWKLPRLNGYKFASIGDSGGDKELAWCIERAHQLGARFLLHLGDFNYQDGDYERAIKLFSNSPIPCYVSIGNHDFHTNGLLVSKFLQEIGPLNNTFAIGPIRYANIDTAADIFPASVGHRGQVLKEMAETSDQFQETVVFTHKPLNDPMEGNNHDIRNVGERDWLIQAFKNATVSTLLSGHIHIYNRETFRGIDNIIAGQGLGHQDLIVNGDHSKMVIGHVDQNNKLIFTAEPLAMPMELHCHPRVDVVKQSLVDSPHYSIIEAIDEACK